MLGMGSYTTTIFVLISAVQKVARVMKLPEGTQLYRGMGGLMDLPEQFFRADAQGVKGFVEWGFMSTTSDLKVETVFEFEYVVRGMGCPHDMMIREAACVGQGVRGGWRCVRALVSEMLA